MCVCVCVCVCGGEGERRAFSKFQSQIQHEDSPTCTILLISKLFFAVTNVLYDWSSFIHKNLFTTSNRNLFFAINTDKMQINLKLKKKNWVCK